MVPSHGTRRIERARQVADPGPNRTLRGIRTRPGLKPRHQAKGRKPLRPLGTSLGPTQPRHPRSSRPTTSRPPVSGCRMVGQPAPAGGRWKRGDRMATVATELPKLHAAKLCLGPDAPSRRSRELPADRRPLAVLMPGHARGAAATVRLAPDPVAPVADRVAVLVLVAVVPPTRRPSAPSAGSPRKRCGG